MKRLNKKILILNLISILILLLLFLFFNTFRIKYVYAVEEQIENVAEVENKVTNGWDLNKEYYYSNSVSVKGFKKINNKRYYFDETTGKKVTGLKKIKGSYYYFNDNGVMQTGWKKINENKYYFLKNKKDYGKAITGIVRIDKKYYQFKKNGKLVKKIDKMTYKANKYSSPTKYLILVNKNTHKVGIYKGKKGNWTRIKNYTCTIGAKGTPTPSGDFSIGGGRKVTRVTYFDTPKVRCWYATRIKGEYYFHSVLYTKNRKPVKIVSGRLGANLSHGCIRLKIENAKWIYKNIPAKTRCIIY